MSSASTTNNTVEIVGLSKTDVLLALYDHAKFAGKAFQTQPMLKIMANMAPQGNRAMAEKLVNEAFCNDNFYFDYIDLGAGPRPIKTDLSGFEFDSTQYDYYHGDKGYAASIINQLRAAYVRQFKNKPKDSFAYLLSQIGSAVISKNKINSNDGSSSSSGSDNDNDTAANSIIFK